MVRSAKNVLGQRILKRQRQVLTADRDEAAGSHHQPCDDSAAGEVTAHYSQSVHLPAWDSICECIPLGSRILDVGCGAAQFAHLLMDRKIPGAYVGFDLSPAAVEIATLRLPGSRVELADARTTDLFSSVDYDIVVFAEVLAHLVDDVPVLKRVPREKHILATVPGFESASHLRSFQNTGEVLDRYRCQFSSLEISEHHTGGANGSGDTFFLLNGVR